MLARIWRFGLAALLLLAAAWAAYWAAHGAAAVAAIGALLILAVHVPLMALEFFVLLPLVNRTDPAPPSTLAQRARAWAEECATAVRVFGWQQPFRSRALPDHLDDPSLRGQRALVLVHGFVCNRGLWNRWMRRLRADGVPHVAVNLEPVFGSISRYVDIVEAAVQRARAATGLAPIVVAHSMGGLATRAWLHAHDGDARVAGVVTIGSPHHGTALARLARMPNGREMRRAGDWLRDLGAQEPATRWTAFTCFYSHCDNIVMPASTAMLDGARNLHVAGCGHVALLDRAVVYDAVLELQRRLPSPPATPPSQAAGDEPAPTAGS